MVHSLLQPVFPVTFAAVSCALTCAWTASAIILPTRSEVMHAPLARANDPPEPFTVVVRTIPITRPANLPFEERWQVQADQPVTQARTEQPALVTTNCIPSHAVPSAAIQFAAAKVAATFTLVEFCPGGAGDEQRPRDQIAIFFFA